MKVTAKTYGLRCNMIRKKKKLKEDSHCQLQRLQFLGLPVGATNKRCFDQRIRKQVQKGGSSGTLLV